MKEDQPFQNFEIKEDLIGNSKGKKKLILIFGTLISILIFIVIIILLIILLKKSNDDSGNNDNNVITDKKDYDDIERFFSFIPSCIKGDANGNLELNRGGINLVKGSQILFTKKYSSSVENIQSYQMNKVSGKYDTSLSLDISIFHIDANFKTYFEKIKEKEYETTSSFLIAKYNLGSLSINNDDVTLSDQMKKKINNIAEDYSLNDKEKAQELDKIFESYGYFIPLTINIGGQFIIDSKDIESTQSESYLLDLIAKINANINYKDIDANITSNSSYNQNNMNIMKNIFNFKKTNIIGGNIYKNNFNDWLNTLTLENCEITGYANIIPITDLLDFELKRKISEPLKQIEKKYNNRKRYIEIYKDLQKKIEYSGWTDEREGTDFDGILIEDDLIYRQNFKIEKEWSTFYVERDFKEPFADIIVGWKIDSQKEKNGKWKLMQNPLLNNRMDAHFESQWLRGIIYEISIYFMDYPE
jgi:hypothetical protein